MQYDPIDPAYCDEADARAAFTRVAAVCVECRRCVERCTVFPGLFDMVERFDDADTGRLTPAEQDGLVAACLGCGVCAHECPYAPGADGVAASIDVPRLMVRMAAMNRARDHVGWRDELTSRALASPRLRRSAWARLAGIDRMDRSGGADRRPQQRDRSTSATASIGRALVISGACPGPHDERSVRDVVAALAALGVEASPAGVRDCGVALWESGDVDRLNRRGRSIVRSLAGSLRADPELVLVVVDPSSRHVLADVLPSIIGRDGDDDGDTGDAAAVALVAARATDASDLALRAPDTASGRPVDRPIVHVTGCHPVDRSRPRWTDLYADGGAPVVEHGCVGCGGWGLRSANAAAREARADRLARRVLDVADANSVVSVECGLATSVLRGAHGIDAVHPLVGWVRSTGLDRPAEPRR